jgi:REP-associated tyrosine transposase
MARKPRIEIPGGLYHVLSRGNNRRKIFRSHDDYLKFTNMLAQQKAKRPFYLYAYCLMLNHTHLLIERQEDKIGKIMQSLLTGYSQYYNRKYKRVGHLFQGRYKAILCQTDRYLGELVRYIHLNPVRAKMVRRPEDYEYSGHRAYIGRDSSRLVDTEAVLRHFGGTKARAVEVYRRFVDAGMGEPSQVEYYRASEGQMLGSEEFLEEIKHRVGDHRATPKTIERTNIEDLLAAAARSSGLTRQELCSKSKNRRTVAVRDAVIVLGRESGISNRELAEALGVDGSSITRRVEAARVRGAESAELKRVRKEVRKKGRKRSADKYQQTQA